MPHHVTFGPGQGRFGFGFGAGLGTGFRPPGPPQRRAAVMLEITVNEGVPTVERVRRRLPTAR